MIQAGTIDNGFIKLAHKLDGSKQLTETQKWPQDLNRLTLATTKRYAKQLLVRMFGQILKILILNLVPL